MCLAEHLKSLEERLARREFAAHEELDALLAEDFREYGASGRAYSRVEALALCQIGHPVEVAISDFSVETRGVDWAFVTYRSCESDGRRANRSSLWVKQNERWRMRFHQGTVVPENG